MPCSEFSLSILHNCCCVNICRIESDPQALWVRPGSQAAQERALYEASFGPFYRIEQLLISTIPMDG